MAKAAKKASSPPQNDRQLPTVGDEPTPPARTRLRQMVEERLAAYDPALGEIDLSNHEIGASEVGWVVARLSQLDGLTALNFSNNEVGEAGTTAITGHLRGLKTLMIASCGVDQAQAVAMAEKLTGLTTLFIGGNAIGDIGAIAIAKHLAKLTTLNVISNEIGQAGASAIAEHLPRLTNLDISRNEIKEAGLSAIAEHLREIDELNVQDIAIRDAAVVVKVLERLCLGGSAGGRLRKIFIDSNFLTWPGMSSAVSQEILWESDPVKLRDLLLSVREKGTELSAAGLAFIGRTEHGKTHAARWVVSTQEQILALRQLIPKDRRTLGYDRYATMLKRPVHGIDGLGDVFLTVVDVGGHREQLNSACNLVYMNARRSVFVLVVKASESFQDGNWGRYYLRLIESLRTRKRSFEDGQRYEWHDLASAGEHERIPVLILVTHSREKRSVQLPTLVQIQSEYPLLDVVSMEEWDAPHGDQYLPVLYKKLGEQLVKLQSLRGTTVGFIKILMDEIRHLFQLDEPDSGAVAPRVGSLSLADFRKLCADAGGHTPEEQEVAIRELVSFGYLARTGRATSWREDTRLLNPRFVNHYLFQKILLDQRTRKNNGYMQVRWLEEMTANISQADRDELLKLMEDCLVIFKWDNLGWTQGMFVPDLLPARSKDEHPVWGDAKCRVRLKPVTFFSEDRFFRFIAGQKEQLRVAHSEVRPDRSRNDILLYRNECVLGDARHPDDDLCKALVKVDVISEQVELAVRGPTYPAARVFAERLIALLANQPGKAFEEQWETGDTTATAPALFMFRRLGKSRWRFACGSSETFEISTHLDGFEYLARLLSQPNRPIPYLELEARGNQAQLVATGSEVTDIAADPAALSAAEEALERLNEGGYGKNPLAVAEQREKLEAFIRKAKGFQGRLQPLTNSPSKNAQTKVCAAIKRAIERFRSDGHPDFADILDRCIVNGSAPYSHCYQCPNPPLWDISFLLPNEKNDIPRRV